MASRKEQKAANRERLRQEMERRRQRSRRNRLLGITAGALVLVVAVVAVGIAVLNNQAANARKGGTPKNAVANGLAVQVGKANAPVTLTVYEDFRCPACKQFELGANGSGGFNATIEKLEDAGKLKVQYHLASLIDANNPGTNGSKVAGNAAACASDISQTKFRAYHDVLYRNQPDEQTDGFTTAKVLSLAKQVPGLADDKTFRSCVQNDWYHGWLQKVQSQFDTRFNGRVATPSMLLNGKVVLGGTVEQLPAEMASPQAFERTVDSMAAGKGSSPAPSSKG
ncbi:MAG: thioredoxin domain-containing protein [Streptosporangiales bacterium]|nr:thioredoxin domain-containing protein [Streptosporangiales bacterium]MBO0891061.1 thioredoxin domain-containing protein [Acidothermales bacterium]